MQTKVTHTEVEMEEVIRLIKQIPISARFNNLLLFNNKMIQGKDIHQSKGRLLILIRRQVSQRTKAIRTGLGTHRMEA